MTHEQLVNAAAAIEAADNPPPTALYPGVNPNPAIACVTVVDATMRCSNGKPR